MKYWLQALLPFFLLTLALPLKAQTGPEPLDEDVELIFHYNPDEIEVTAAAEAPTLEQKMFKEFRTPEPTNKYFVPLAPSTEDLLEHFEHLNDDDAQAFLRKKQSFLLKISEGLQKIRIPVFIHNKLLKKLNDDLFHKSHLVARANRTTFEFRIPTFSLGIGIGHFLTKGLKGTKLGNLLPEHGGFYFGLSLGFGISRVEENGKIQWIFEVFADRDSLKSVRSFLFLAGVGTDVGFAVENREGNVKRYNMSGRVLGIGGVISNSLNHSGYNAGVGVSLPPLINKLMSWDFHRIRQVLKTFVISEKNLCEEVFL